MSTLFDELPATMKYHALDDENAIEDIILKFQWYDTVLSILLYCGLVSDVVAHQMNGVTHDTPEREPLRSTIRKKN